MKTPTVNVTPLQEQVLQGLLRSGGTCAYKQVVRVCYGLRWEDVSGTDHSRLGVSVRGLERRGFVVIGRRWGTGGYGQPETVALTDVGRALAESG